MKADAALKEALLEHVRTEVEACECSAELRQNAFECFKAVCAAAYDGFLCLLYTSPSPRDS